MQSKGKVFRQLVERRQPLKVVGVINSYTGILAKNAGIEAIYLSGAGVANANFGLPDLGLTSLTDVANEVSKITNSCELPLLVDGDTGWGGPLNVEHTVKILINNGAAAVHFEDQQWPKRCGHRDNKSLISNSEMTEKIRCASEKRNELDPDFIIMARTDALAVEGIDASIQRAKEYVDAGADMIFFEAVTKLDEYKQCIDALPNVPVLANITEFGKTPLFTEQELKEVGIGLMLFPLSAFRAMSKAAQTVYEHINTHGSQKDILSMMQSRQELYDNLDYESFESRMNN